MEATEGAEKLFVQKRHGETAYKLKICQRQSICEEVNAFRWQIALKARYISVLICFVCGFRQPNLLPRLSTNICSIGMGIAFLIHVMLKNRLLDNASNEVKHAAKKNTQPL